MSDSEDYKLQLTAMLYPTRDNIITSSRRFVDRAAPEVKNKLILDHLYGEWANGIAMMDISRQKEIGGIAYYENSCWVDSTIQALLSTPVPYVYRTLLYRHVRKDEKARCRGYTDMNLSDFQNALLNIKEELQTGRKIVISCQNLRDKLLMCMAQDYSADALYMIIYVSIQHQIEVILNASPYIQDIFLLAFHNLFSTNIQTSFFGYILRNEKNYIAIYHNDVNMALSKFDLMIDYFKETDTKGDYTHSIKGISDYSIIREWIQNIPLTFAKDLYKSLVIQHNANNAGVLIEALFKMFGVTPPIINLRHDLHLKSESVVVNPDIAKSVDMLILNGDNIAAREKVAPESIGNLNLFSFIVGIDNDSHYVSFIKFENSWLYFNDMDISSVRYIEAGTKIDVVRYPHGKRTVKKETITESGFYHVSYDDRSKTTPRIPNMITNPTPVIPNRVKYNYQQLVTLPSFVSEFGKEDKINVKKDARIWFYKR